jgi:hypothetical protein
LRKCSHKRRKELEARESIEKQIRNKFKSKPLPMKKESCKETSHENTKQQA